MARRWRLVAIVVVCPLVWALTSVAEASPKSPPQQNRMVLAGEGTVIRSAPVPRTDEPAPAIQVIPAALAAGTVIATFVDPAGGHAPVRPIEATSPYRAR